MHLAALIPILVFGVILSAVGIRLLLLARRTREWPELFLGLGLVQIAFVGMPLTAVGRIPATVGTPLGHGLFAVGILIVVGGISLLYAFNWRVFRPYDLWAKLALGVAWLALAGIGGALAYVPTQAATLADILPRTRPFALAVLGMLALLFCWTAVESLHYHRLLRRRVVFGLADPVVTNRFLLWGLSGVATTVLCGGLVVCLETGLAILIDTVPLAMIALTGSITSVTWSLTFFPPEAYQQFLRRRAAKRS